jgi:hypothetical protein
LAFASSACSANSSNQNIQTTATSTLTQFIFPPEDTQTVSPSPSLNPEETINATPTLSTDIPGNSNSTPTNQGSNTVPPAGHGSGPQCNDAGFVEDVSVPDGTLLAPEKDFKKTWRIKNTGTCQWTTSYAIGFAYGDKLGGTDTKLPNSVDPGSTVDISVGMSAPKVNGWYGGWWRLKSETGAYFGDFVYVSIQVSSSQ